MPVNNNDGHFFAFSSGVPASVLLNGDGMNVQFEDSSFDMVCEFGMLHHVRYPEKVISEMLRVASKAIYISDCNNFGSGSLLSRSAKQFITALVCGKHVIGLK